MSEGAEASSPAPSNVWLPQATGIAAKKGSDAGWAFCAPSGSPKEEFLLGLLPFDERPWLVVLKS